jgi:hypothetical protein
VWTIHAFEANDEFNIDDGTTSQQLHVILPLMTGNHLLSLLIHLRSFPETTANRLLVLQLEHVLATCNRRFAVPSGSSSSSSSSVTTTASSLANNRSLKSYPRIASCKILRHCTRDERMHNWECIEGIEIEMLAPHVFAWLANNGKIGVMFNVIREMPWLVEISRSDGENDRSFRRTLS